MKNLLYKTKDLWEAAALLANKTTLKTIERQGNICFFVFEDAQKAEGKAQEYYFGDLTVNAFEYQESVSKLKKHIFKNKTY